MAQRRVLNTVLELLQDLAEGDSDGGVSDKVMSATHPGLSKPAVPTVKVRTPKRIYLQVKHSKRRPGGEGEVVAVAVADPDPVLEKQLLSLRLLLHLPLQHHQHQGQLHLLHQLLQA
ncbi:UNVERIFIED_CONTAM: hypothetical protein FKN15_024507 [Acipenser sinensis]